MDAPAVVRVVGELDGASVPRLHATITDIIMAGGRDVVLDVEGMTFVDSTGLGGMIDARQLLIDLGGSLVLRAPSVETRKVLAIAGLTDVFPVEG